MTLAAVAAIAYANQADTELALACTANTFVFLPELDLTSFKVVLLILYKDCFVFPSLFVSWSLKPDVHFIEHSSQCKCYTGVNILFWKPVLKTRLMYVRLTVKFGLCFRHHCQLLSF